MISMENSQSLSQESSADLVQEAFRVGALGYVVKTDARSELMTVVSGILRGETLTCSRRAEHGFTEPSVQPSVKMTLS